MMYSSKLFHFIRQLEPLPRARFGDYLAADYFHAPEPVRQLWEVIEREKLDHREGLTEETCFAKAFPGKPFNRNQFRKLKSLLLSHLVGFWEVEVWNERDAARAVARLEHLNRFGENRYFPLYLRRAEAKIDALSETIEGLYLRRRWVLAAYAYEVRQARRQPAPLLVQAQTLLRDYAAAEAVHTAYLARNEQRITGQPIPVTLEDHDLKYLKANASQLPAEARGYFFLYQCLSDPESAPAYQALKSLLHFDGPPPDWAPDLLTGALNHCFRRYNAGDEAFLPEIMEWYRRTLVEGVLVQQGKLLPAHLKNAVSVAGKLDHCDWAEEMVARFADSPNGRDYNRGTIAFYRKDYPAAIHHFYRVLQDFEDEFYGLDGRIFLLCAYYLKGEWAPTEALSAALRMYVRRCRTLNAHRRQRYGLFIRFFRRLVELPPFDADRRDRLRRDLEATDPFPSRKWLLKQISGGEVSEKSAL